MDSAFEVWLTQWIGLLFGKSIFTPQKVIGVSDFLQPIQFWDKNDKCMSLGLGTEEMEKKNGSEIRINEWK